MLPDTVLLEAGGDPPAQRAVILVTLRLWLTRWSLQVEAGLGDQLPTRQRQGGGQDFMPVVGLEDAGLAPPSQYAVIFLTLRVCVRGLPAHTVDRPGPQVPVLHRHSGLVTGPGSGRAGGGQGFAPVVGRDDLGLSPPSQ